MAQPMRLTAFVVLFATATSALVSAQRDEHTRALVQQFEQAVAIYRQWEVARARTHLEQLSVFDQRIAAAALLARERFNARASGASTHDKAASLKLLRAAAALEMESAAEDVRSATTLGGANIIQIRVRIAFDLLAYVEQQADPPARTAERWLTAIGIESLSRGQFELAPEFLTPTCRQDPAYAPLLLTCGIAQESFSVLSYDTARTIRHPDGPGLNRALARKYRGAALRLARQFLERSLALAPNDAETSLRLAQVRLRQGDRREGVALLEALTARQGLPARVSYLARMFLGRAYEDAGRLTDAQRAYSGALAVGQAQSALLALSNNAQLLGRAGEAAALAERAATMKPALDPWWRYAFGQYWMAADLFTALRKEALE